MIPAPTPDRLGHSHHPVAVMEPQEIIYPMNNKLLSYIGWLLVAVLGAFALGAVALNRGETVSAVWLVTASLCVYFIGYRFYSKFIAERVLQLDDGRMTPAVSRNDGLRITSRPINGCCTATISPLLPAGDRWSGQCWPRRWVICPAPSGFWLA